MDWWRGLIAGLLFRKHEWRESRKWFDGFIAAGAVYMIAGAVVIEAFIITVAITIWEHL